MDLTPGPGVDQERNDEPTQTAQHDCRHVYSTHIRGGEPVAVRICMLCDGINWDDLREQVTKIQQDADRAGREEAARDIAEQTRREVQSLAAVDDGRALTTRDYQAHALRVAALSARANHDGSLPQEHAANLADWLYREADRWQADQPRAGGSDA